MDHELRSFLELTKQFPPLACFSRINMPDADAISRLVKALDDQEYQDNQICKDINDVKAVPLPPLPAFSTPQWGNVCGPDWDGHPFRHAPLIWWREALEPDVTRMIKIMCSPSDSGHDAAIRAQTFLEALRAALFDKSNKPSLPFKLESREAIQVEAEKATSKDARGNKGRLDLIFSKDEACVAIEAKFDASWDNDLELYKKDIKKRKYKNWLLVILGCKDKREQKDIKNGWYFAYWIDVLRYWEHFLYEKANHKKHNVDFSRVRATIWEKTVRHS